MGFVMTAKPPTQLTIPTTLTPVSSGNFLERVVTRGKIGGEPAGCLLTGRLDGLAVRGIGLGSE